jgi:hypothetical protein
MLLQRLHPLVQQHEIECLGEIMGQRLRPGSLVLADDARYCAEFVSHMRTDASRYVSVPLAGDLEMSMRLF